MAQDIVSGLFGLSPYEEAEKAYQSRVGMAEKIGNISPENFVGSTAASLGMGLSGMFNQAMGREDPRIRMAQERQQALQGLDLSSSQSILAKAQQVQDPKLRMQLALLGQQKAKEEREASLNEFKIRDEALFRRTEREQQRADKMELAKEQINAKMEQAKLRSEDMRLSIQQRADAAKEANALRMSLAQMAAALKQSGTDKVRSQVVTNSEGDAKLVNLDTGDIIKDLGKIGKSRKEDEKATSQQAAMDSMEFLVSSLNDTYDQLNAAKGITSTQRGSIDNIGSQIATSGIGQTIGGFLGTENQKLRNDVKTTRPLLMQAIVKATGMTAKQIDSQAELKLLLNAATDPDLGYEANKGALKRLTEWTALKSKGNAPMPTTPQGGNDLIAAARAELAKRKGGQ